MNLILIQHELFNKLFNSYKWFNDKSNKNDKTDLYNIIYRKNKIKNEYFEIKLDNYKILVTIPIKNSIYQYQTTFNNYKDTLVYLDKYIKYYDDDDDIDLELGFGN